MTGCNPLSPASHVSASLCTSQYELMSSAVTGRHGNRLFGCLPFSAYFTGVVFTYSTSHTDEQS